MATSTPPSSPGQPGSNSTRQLLDELDALMQRMLALPVGDDTDSQSVAVKENAAPAVPLRPSLRHPSPLPPSETAEPEQASTVTAPEPPPPPDTPIQSEDRDAEASAPVTTSLRTFWPPSEPSLPPAFEKELPSAGPLPPEPLLPRPPLSIGPDIFTALTSRPGGLGSLKAPVSRPKPQPVPAWGARWMAPLVWANRTFDRGCLRLGGPGRWLRGAKGRAVLGWLGVAMLAAALALQVALWIRWTR